MKVIIRENEEEARHASGVIVWVFVGIGVCLLSCTIPAWIIMSEKGISLLEFINLMVK